MPKKSDTRIESGTGAIESAFTPDTTAPKETTTKSTPLARGVGITGRPPFVPPEATLLNIPYITVSQTGSLNAERFLVAGSGITIVDNGPNNSIVLSVNDAALQLAGSTNIEVSGIFVGSRPTINFLQESTIRLTAVDDPLNNKIDITLSANIDIGVSSVTLSAGAGIVITNPTITSAGIISVGLDTTGVNPDYYNFVEVDIYGRVIGAQNIEYITRNSSFANFVQQGQLTNLGQFNNDQGYVSAQQFTGGGIIEVFISGKEIRVSANQASFSTFVEVSALDVGATIIASISGGDEIRQRTIVANGGIELTETATQIIISARAAPINTSDLINDSGYITTVIAQQLVDNLSALSQFTNDVGFITGVQVSSVGTGNDLTVGVSGTELLFKRLRVNGGLELTDTGLDILISAPSVPVLFSQLVNDLNLISEPSALALLANLSVLSQFIDDVGYATYNYVDTTFVFNGDLSALSQFNNNQGFVSAAQFTGGGIISVEVSGVGAGLEIRISANSIGGGGLTETSAQSLIESYGFITEVSADLTYVTQGDLTALSQFTNDVGYITEASAVALLTSVGATQVTQTPLGLGVSLITSISGLGDIQQRTIVGAGSIQVNASLTEITISAAPSPTLLSELDNDVGYITEASAVFLIAALSASDVSAVSQLTNDAGYITEASAIALLSTPETDRILGYNGDNFVIASAPSNTVSMGTNGQTVITITASGNVGIGTETPTTKLEIFEASAESSFIKFATVLTGQGDMDGMVIGIADNSLDFTIRNNEDGKIRLISNSIEAFVVDASGNVGVRTEAPTQTFEVNGTAKFTQVIISGQSSYKLPISAGTANYALTTDGAGNTYWAAVNGSGITEGSAVSLIESYGFITEASANLVFVNEGDLSALSQFTNDAGYFNTVSAAGGGQSIVAFTSASELTLKTVVGGGSVEVTTVGNTIRVSANTGGGGAAAFQFRINFSGNSLEPGNEVTELPSGWSFTVNSNQDVTITHNTGRQVSTVQFSGYQQAPADYLINIGPTTNATVRQPITTIGTSFRLFVLSNAQVGAGSGQYAYVRLNMV